MRVQLLMGVALCTLAGCGGGSKLAPVSGVVTLNGKPLEGATVTFSPADLKVKEAPTSIGTTDENGRFELETIDGRKGAFIGKHNVTIVKETGEQDDDDDTLKEPESEVPAKYNDDSTMTFDVTSDGSEQADFKLTAEKGWKEKEKKQRRQEEAGQE